MAILKEREKEITEGCIEMLFTGHAQMIRCSARHYGGARECICACVFV